MKRQEPMSRKRFLMTWVKRLSAVAAFVTAIACLWLVGFLAFVNGMQRQANPAIKADGIVVLTGGDARLSEAMNLLAQERGKRLLISGVDPVATDGDVKSLLADPNGLFECCVDLGRSATDTISNAEEASAWAGEHGYSSLIVVTANYHMPRSLLEFERAMPDVEIIAFPIQSDSVPVDGWWRRNGTRKFLASEFNKFVLAFVRARFLAAF